jgi:hypothetical protein
MSNFSTREWDSAVRIAQKMNPYNGDPSKWVSNREETRADAHWVMDAAKGLDALKYGDNRPPHGGKKFKSNKKAQSKRRKMSKKSQTKRRK